VCSVPCGDGDELFLLVLRKVYPSTGHRAIISLENDLVAAIVMGRIWGGWVGGKVLFMSTENYVL
jgi:hypothetical protein